MIDKEIFINEKAWLDEWYKQKKDLNRCARCAYDELTAGIIFNEKGICNYCLQHDELIQQYPGGEKGQSEFSIIVEKIKKEGKNKPYDVIVGVSGGCDSSYMLTIAKDAGLRPLAVHFDNTWNSTIAVQNIHNVLKKLNVELWTYVVNNEEYDDLYLSILKAGVSDIEAATDLALATTLNMAASKYKIKYILEGHSFRSEGISPLGWMYMDAKYLHGMHKKFGKLSKLRSYPFMWLHLQMKWMLLDRFKKVRPLWYLDYNKNEAKKILSSEYGWQWYGGHHLENRMTAFYHTYFLPRRFGIDQRANGFSALVRSNQMSRQEAIELLETPPTCEIGLVEMIIKRWGLSNEEFLNLMTLPRKRYTDYKTYKKTFERLRPFFYCMAKLDLVPWSFYCKYTAKTSS